MAGAQRSGTVPDLSRWLWVRWSWSHWSRPQKAARRAQVSLSPLWGHWISYGSLAAAKSPTSAEKMKRGTGFIGRMRTSFCEEEVAEALRKTEKKGWDPVGWAAASGGSGFRPHLLKVQIPGGVRLAELAQQAHFLPTGRTAA